MTPYITLEHAGDFFACPLHRMGSRTPGSKLVEEPTGGKDEDKQTERQDRQERADSQTSGTGRTPWVGYYGWDTMDGIPWVR